MPETNGTLLHWLIRIDERLESIDDKLDTKADSEVVSALAEEVRSNTKDVSGIKGKVAVISALIGAGVSSAIAYFK